MKINYENTFDYFENDDKSRVFQIYPDCFEDKRGYFMEVFKDYGEWPFSDIPLWFSNSTWIRQINRSSSSPGVIRGCHAQKGIFCQGKLVEAVNEKVYDVITDMRPHSKTFGVSSIFILDPLIHNKVWVPRGFLHAFVVPISVKNNAIFEYFCDNSYKKEAEICINPKTLVTEVVEKFKNVMGKDERYFDLYETLDGKSIFSEKDLNGTDYEDFCCSVLTEFNNTGKLWHE